VSARYSISGLPLQSKLQFAVTGILNAVLKSACRKKLFSSVLLKPSILLARVASGLLRFMMFDG
jgi:hypothetical protein